MLVIRLYPKHIAIFTDIVSDKIVNEIIKMFGSCASSSKGLITIICDDPYNKLILLSSHYDLIIY